MIRTKTFFHRLVAALLVFAATISTALAADSGTGWSYDSGTNTLTLSGSEVDWTAIKDFSSTTEHVLFAEDYAVSSLPDEAFSKFYNLQSIDIPDVVTSIGYRAFYNCISLASATLPEGLTSINKSTFYSCRSLTSISIPEGVTSIGDYAISLCRSLTSISIPEGVTSIGRYAFQASDAITSVTLPASLTSMSICAFDLCSSLETVEIRSDGTSEDKHVIYLGDGNKNDKNATGKSEFLRNRATLIYNPNTTWIGEDDTQNLRYYFNKFKLLGGTGWSYETATNTLTLFGDEVDWEGIKEFSSTTEHVVFAEDYAVSSIPNEAFNLFPKLEGIEIPSVVTSIGDYAFYDCSSLSSVTLPASLTLIGDYAFNGCSSLATVAFLSDGTSDNKHFITLGGSDNKNATGTDVFPRNIATLVFNPTTTWIGDDDTQNFRYYFSDLRGTGWSYDSSSNTLTLFGSEVDWEAIKEFKKTTEHVVFAEDYAVSSIPYEAFMGFSKLGDIEIPEVVTSIGDHAFNGCTSLSSVTFPEGLTSIGKGAFISCSSLPSVTLPEGLTSIGNGTFIACTSLASVSLPDGLTSIGENAFFRCSSLASISFPEGLTSIGECAFWQCSSLTSVTLPASLTSLGEDAFAYCSSITTVEILSNGTPDNKHVIYLGYDGDKASTGGDNVFPRDQASLIYDPNTTWIGDRETENLRYYFNSSYIPTSIKPNVISNSTSRFYDLGGRPVSPSTHKGIAVKLQDGKSSIVSIK